MYHFKNNSGQTLIEVIVALSAVLLVLAAISIALTTAVNNSTFIKNQNVASKFAQQGMEYIRHEYANNEAFFDSYTEGIHMMGEDNSIELGEFQVNIGESFVRTVDVQKDVVCDTARPDLTALQITVSVYWSSGKCGSGTVGDRFCHSSELVTCFSDRPTSDLSL